MRTSLAIACFLLGATVGLAHGPRIGDEAPALVLPDRDGARVALSELRGRVVCVDFWASWCASCRTALPALDRIARRHGGDGLDVLAVDIDSDRAAGDRFLAERVPDSAMTVLHDGDGAALDRFGATAMPALYLVDRRGVLRLVEAGYDPARLDEVEKKIVELLAEPAARP